MPRISTHGSHVRDVEFHRARFSMHQRSKKRKRPPRPLPFFFLRPSPLLVDVPASSFASCTRAFFNASVAAHKLAPRMHAFQRERERDRQVSTRVEPANRAARRVLTRFEQSIAGWIYRDRWAWSGLRTLVRAASLFSARRNILFRFSFPLGDISERWFRGFLAKIDRRWFSPPPPW